MSHLSLQCSYIFYCSWFFGTAYNEQISYERFLVMYHYYNEQSYAMDKIDRLNQ